MFRLIASELGFRKTAAVSTASGAALVGFGAMFLPKFALAIPLLAAGAGLLLWRILEDWEIQRLIFRLAESDQPRSTMAALRQLEDTMRTVRHRLNDLHPLTDLPTQERLRGEIGADIATGDEPHLLGAVRLVDFDRLASFDRAAADEALIAFAARLRGAVKATHLVGQVDRDCFCIWFRTAGDLDAALAEFRAVLYVSAQPFQAGSRMLNPSLEASSTRYPQDGADPVQLLFGSAAALAPTSGALAEPSTHDPARKREAEQQYELEQGLAEAIEEDRLAMVFQPVVDATRGRLMGAEALLRWTHPTLGTISPTRFIPMMETMGLSDRFGFWVLNTACREAKRWREAGLDQLKVAVNLSARQLLDPQLCTKVERTLRRHDLAASALELELTETAAMADAAWTQKVFEDIRDLGVSLAIDDFGTGYSSLSYLKNLPFNKLKIDREFVRQVDRHRDSQAICKALIELGRGLDLLVLAEGVEAPAEVLTLQQLGCDVFQGYLFSKPRSAEEFFKLAFDDAWIGACLVAPSPSQALDAA
jgi:Amt family ammonium transporter